MWKFAGRMMRGKAGLVLWWWALFVLSGAALFYVVMMDGGKLACFPKSDA